MQFGQTVEVSASASQLWQAVADIEHWPEWIATFSDVTWLTAATADPQAAAALRPGGRARIRQPGLPELIWEVSEVRPGASFTWRARSPGVSTVGTHAVRALAADRAELTIGLAATGPLALFVGLLTRGKTRRYLQQEAEGLKRCAEVAASTPG